MIILTSHSTSSAVSHSLSSELIAARLTQAGGAAWLPLLFLIEPDRLIARSQLSPYRCKNQDVIRMPKSRFRTLSLRVKRSNHTPSQPSPLRGRERVGRLPRLRAETPASLRQRIALRRAGTHLFPLLAGLAMTDWEKAFIFWSFRNECE